MPSVPATLDGLDRRGRLRVLAICSLSLFIVGIDVTAVNLALPSIRGEFAVGLSALQWVLDAYTVVLAALLVLSGSVADRVGRKRVFRIGLVVFGLGSLACSVAPSIGLLVAARAVQAVGGSMLNPVAMSIITNTFIEPRERARAIGVWGAMFGASMSLGPVVGGGLVDWLGWRSIFWLNVPIVIAALTLTTRYVPESRASHPRRLDPAGQVLIAVGLGAAVFGIIEGENVGWTSPLIIGAFVLAALAIALFVAVERRVPEPLVDLRFFSSVPFSGSLVASVCAFAANGATLFMVTLYLQSARGLRPLDAGLVTVPMALATALSSPLSGRMVASRGVRTPMALAGVTTVLAALPLLSLTPDTTLVVVLVALAVFGIGQGLVNAPITNAAISGMPRAQAGVAGALASTSRQVGTALGIAVVGALMATANTSGSPAQMAASTHSGWVLVGCCGVAVAGLAFVTTSPKALASAAAIRT